MDFLDPNIVLPAQDPKNCLRRKRATVESLYRNAWAQKKLNFHNAIYGGKDEVLRKYDKRESSDKNRNYQTQVGFEVVWRAPVKQRNHVEERFIKTLEKSPICRKEERYKVNTTTKEVVSRAETIRSQ